MTQSASKTAISFTAVNVAAMSLKQLCSFANHNLSGACGETRHYDSKEDLIDWLMNDSEEDIEEEMTFNQVKEKIQEIFCSFYPFDGDHYISCFDTYTAKKEEIGAFYFTKDLPLLGKDCKVYASLRRIVYYVSTSEVVDDDILWGSLSPVFVELVRTKRITFGDYIEKLQRQQSKISQTLDGLAQL